MNRIKSEAERLRNDPVVVSETVEQIKEDSRRTEKRKKKSTSKQLHKSMTLEKRRDEGRLQEKKS